ncbi:DUF1549 and DUF1553 domain-containing protein [Planctomyces sp. SH-PL62]|uniref:DUF1549 and DUF1553 domain-containing protein n=1 Tax=Planctomyces sp. SH-PL62 TaxID=1636152 RepID=UPI00078BDF5B|nr:DUF1549 and DUF1553 domain-containing protein [Planctomyces sp. SH-PL62]AMV39380.1 hypothetical protein VT85_18225 [Planctomyces sp. SH-PL62]
MIQSTAAFARALRTSLAGLVLAGLAPPLATAADPAAPLPDEVFAPDPVLTAGLVEIQVFPAAVDLTTARDRQSVVVQGFYSDGLTRDLTPVATFTPADPSLVVREGATFLPRVDGETTMTVAFGGQSATIPLKVARAATAEPLSFRLDVMPVFLRAGCNTGSCHGAARGKDGFRLSLFGYDPEGDYFRLTREMVGRRVNLALPADSTLLEKSIGAVQHTGGKRFEPGDVYYRSIHEWITAGALNDDVSKLPKVVGVELYPKAGVLDGKGSEQQMTVLAKYSDGTDRDVTGLALFLTNNDSSAAVSPDGLVKAGERGEAFVMARFETFTVGSQFIVLPKALQFAYPDESTGNYIDELVADKLRKLRIAPSEICDDATFVRRVFLDIVGLTPTVAEFDQFMTSADPDKRAKLVDELLQRKEFSEIWVSKWAELLQIRTSLTVSYKSMFLYYNWLVEQLSKDLPMDQMVQELLGANGGTFKNPATNFYQTTTETLPLTENVAQVFMGMRIQCAQCHNHPFDRWTQDEYYSFAAFFSQIGRKQGEDFRELIVFNAGGGEMKHPVDGRVMAPKFLGGESPDVAGKDRRVILAKWLASSQNPWFATSFANRVWAHFMGVGVVEPVDDFRISNPATNPELLEALGKRFTESNYNLKSLVRDICTSRAYQRSTHRNESNAGDDRNFSHALVRRIKAENLLDAISHVTNTKDKFGGLPLGARAVQIADGNSSTYFLTTFGRATRETPCSCEVKMEPTLSQALHLLNGDTVNAKIKQGGVLDEVMKDNPAAEDRIADLYLRCLSRRPTPDELAKLTPMVSQAPDQAQALGDVFWALLNSREFLFNH